MSTYTPVASIILSAATSSITFSGIPQTYNDLILVCNIKGDGANIGCNLRFNNDTGSNYSTTQINGNGSPTTGANRYSNQTSIFTTSNYSSGTNDWATVIWNIPNYTNITTDKVVLARYSRSTYEVSFQAGLYRSTSPISSITLNPVANSFISGSTFNIYGISSSLPVQAKAIGGNTIVSDGTYWYHTFLSSGAFIPSENLTVDYLVVGGGGGGGVGGNGSSAYGGGGGGAGGVRCTVGATGGGGSLESALSLTKNTNYPVLIGGGGSGTGNGRGYSGSPTTFSTITSAGGGGGGGTNPDFTGVNGGSGGGSSLGGGGTSGTANQGYGGGTSSSQGGGGGGGAGAAGSSTNNNNGAAGGNGIQTSISGTATYYGGGGGGGGTGTGSSTGGAGGLGGGGTGSASTGTYTPAQDNTGGGGYGGNNARGSSEKGGASGIVIVRYAV